AGAEERTMTIGVVGLGNIGTAMANLIATNGYPVVGWEHDQRVVAEVNSSHTNSTFLPGVALSPNLSATGRLADVVGGCETIFIALPSLFIRPTLEPVRGALRGDAVIVNLAKGIERSAGLTS